MPDKFMTPERQDQALVLYRQGLSHEDVATLMGVTVNTMRKEVREDPEYGAKVKEAMTVVFTPVLKHAIDLAKEADAAGENEGSIKALDMVMRFFSKELDRQSNEAIVDRKIEAGKEQQDKGVPALNSPEAVASFLASLTAPAPLEIEEADTEEEESDDV